MNSAGCFYHPPATTEDGFDWTFQTNYLSVFYLINSLLPLLEKTHQTARIVNLSSKSHLYVDTFPLPELHVPFADSPDNRFKAYFYSKFCLVLLSWKLRAVLCRSEISVHCVDPGNVETNIYRHFPSLSTPWKYYLQKPIRLFLCKTPWEGAQGVLHAILKTETPQFYIENISGTENFNPAVKDPKLGPKLWSESQKMVLNRPIRSDWSPNYGRTRAAVWRSTLSASSTYHCWSPMN